MKSARIQYGDHRSGNRQGPGSSRKGFSLVEMLASLAVISILAGLGAKLIVEFLRLNSAVTEHAESRLILEQLEDQMREDARGASSSRLTPGEPVRLEVPQQDGTLTVWEFAAERTLWKRTRGEVTLAQEQFPVSLTNVEWNVLGRLATLRAELLDTQNRPSRSAAERSFLLTMDLGGARFSSPDTGSVP